jgi:Skp family chaperone for outer membrane proteins
MRSRPARVHRALWAALVASLLAGRPEAAVPATLEPSVVAVVDFERLIRDSLAGRSLREQIDAQRSTFQAEVAEAEETLRAEDQELQRLQESLDPTAFAERRQRFQAEVAEVQRMVQTRKQILDRAQGAGIDEIKKTTIDIIGEMAKEQGFNLVLSLSQVLLVDSDYDLTQRVMDELNRRLPSVKVNFAPE